MKTYSLQHAWARQTMARMLCLCAIAFAALLTGGCASMVSDQQELALGEQYRKQLDQELTFDPSMTNQAYIDRLGRRLVAYAPPRPAIPYTFRLVVDDSLNAFAIPGGHIYVQTGVVKSADTESELAAVMAHEIGHVAALHHKETIAKSMGVELLNDVLFGEEESAGRVLGGIVGKGILLKYSRTHEYEADRVGIEILSRAGYDPNGLPAFFSKLIAESGGSSNAVFEKFSSHPLTIKRVTSAQAMIDAMAPNPNAIRDSTAFQGFKARVEGQ